MLWFLLVIFTIQIFQYVDCTKNQQCVSLPGTGKGWGWGMGGHGTVVSDHFYYLFIYQLSLHS